MTARERSGQRVFLLLASLTVLVKLGGVVLGIVGHGPPFDRLLSLVLALTVPFLWRGTVRVQWLVGLAYGLSGARRLFDCGRSLVDFDVLGTSAVFEAILGLADIVAGLAFVFLPALNAFFAHQRAGKPAGRADADADADAVGTLPGGRVSLPRVKAAAVFGLILGCGSGAWLAAEEVWAIGFDLGWQEVGASFLAGLGAGAVLGLTAGVAVGAVGPGPGLTTRRLLFSRGLIAAGACLVAAIVLAAAYGGLFAGASADFPANPGLPRAAMAAAIWVIFGGPIVAAAGFALGIPIALFVRDADPPKPRAPLDRAGETPAD